MAKTKEPTECQSCLVLSKHVTLVSAENDRLRKAVTYYQDTLCYLGPQVMYRALPANVLEGDPLNVPEISHIRVRELLEELIELRKFKKNINDMLVSDSACSKK